MCSKLETFEQLVFYESCGKLKIAVFFIFYLKFGANTGNYIPLWLYDSEVMKNMKWQVDFHDNFLKEFDTLHEEVQDSIFIMISLLNEFGFKLGRPYVDNLSTSKFSNMKELRFNVNAGIWRVAFAFDLERKAILLVAGDKKGKNQKIFYKKLIDKADYRYKAHLEQLKNKEKYE